MAKIKTFLLCFLFLALCIHSAGAHSLREKVREQYSSQVGVREATGRNDGPVVETYLATVKQKRGAAWCAAFVAWVLDQCGIKNPMNAWSPAWFPKANTIYHRGKFSLQPPQAGEVFGLYYANLKRIGHVGFVDKWGSEWTTTVEGNTNADGSREGNGVWRKRRLTRQIYKVSTWIKE